MGSERGESWEGERPREPDRASSSDLSNTRRGTVFVSGFTLIELLVTVVILSTGIVLILQAFQTSMVALAASRDSMRSASLSHALLAQAELAVRNRGGDASIEDDILRARYPDYRWRVNTQTDSNLPCTNSLWVKAEVVTLVSHDITGRELEVASWVQVQNEEAQGRD